MADSQFKQVHPALQERPEMQSDVDAADVSERSFSRRFQPVQCEALEPDSALPEAPVKIVESDGRSGPPLDLLHDIVAGAGLEIGRFEVRDDGDNGRHDREGRHQEYEKDAASTQKPQGCSFCESLPASPPLPDSFFPELHCPESPATSPR